MNLSDLTTPLSADAIKASIYTGLANVGVSTTSWKPGAVVRTIIAVLAVILAAFARLIAAIASGGFLDLATADWLTLVAQYVYGVTRNTGSFATGNVTLTNGGGGTFTSVAIGDLIVKNTATGVTYRNTATFSLSPIITTATVPVQAEILGADGTSGAGAIDALVTTFSGVTVINAAALIGSDPETDEQLRARCREKLGVLSPNGPKDAYSFLAKSATRTDGSSIGVTRVRSIPDGIGGVDVYVADADGSVDGDPDDLATDLGVINDAIQTQAAPLAITARLHSATPVTIPVTYEIWIRNTSSMTDAQVEDAIEAALLTYVSGQPIGGEIISPATGKTYVSGLRGAITSAVSSYLIRLDVSAPSGDVSIGTTEAPVLGAVTPTVHQLATGAL